MLRSVKLSGVGPAPSMEISFASRINAITGDNGLGKSFLLEIAWWALTRKWSSLPAHPQRDFPAKPEISFALKSKTRNSVSYTSSFDFKTQSWTGRPGRPSIPGLVLFARSDGGFAVWDPARNYWNSKETADGQSRPGAYVFQPKDVWDGLTIDGKSVCNGLILDWALWQKERGDAFASLATALDALSADRTELLAPGELTSIDLDESREIPTIRMPYGQDVPILFVSAGMKRIIALAYLLVWSLREHQRACRIRRESPAKQIVFLVDEIEAHLHPKWQRSVLSSLLSVMTRLTKRSNIKVQVITATHSPLVLASLESLFDASSDALFDLDLIPPETKKGKPRVELRTIQWRKRGDVSNWLTSEAFGLKESRSIESEQVIEDASALLGRKSPDKKLFQATDRKLRTVLGDSDPFWIRWNYVAERKGLKK